MALIPTPAEQQSRGEFSRRATPFLRRNQLWIVVGSLAAGFLLAPWPFEVKAHAVLHGICGQTPSHTMTFAGMELPLDSRCVGIFGGLLVTFLLLIGLGRWRAAGLPSIGAGVLLLFFLGGMGLDGLNSLMTDLDRRHLYAPSNDLRLLTGWMAGVGLGSVLLMVTGMCLWERPRTSMRVLPNWWWPVALLVPVLPVWLLLRTGWKVVFYPASLGLIAAAVTAFATLAVCAIVMLRNRDNGYRQFDQLVPLATIGVLIAVALMLAISGGRFWMEDYFHLQPPA